MRVLKREGNHIRRRRVVEILRMVFLNHPIRNEEERDLAVSEAQYVEEVVEGLSDQGRLP